jgi:PBP1b-binding outer membrane lipoprotein LpoB
MKIFILTLAILLTGCSIVAPPYQVSIDNVQQIKQANVDKITVEEIKSSKKLDSISLRGNQLKPASGSFGKYISSAIIEELKLANKYHSLSAKVVSGELVANDLDITGFSTGTGTVEVRFIVTENNKLIFEKNIQANSRFESSFMGAVAISNAQSSYDDLIQILIKQLFEDQEFLSAIETNKT